MSTVGLWLCDTRLIAVLFFISDYKLNVKHKTTLLSHFNYLKDNLTLSRGILLDMLLQTAVLNDHEVDEINSKKTERDKVDQLLHFITRTSPEQYISFLESLNNANHEHVYIKLRGIYILYTIWEREGCCLFERSF